MRLTARGRAVAALALLLAAAVGYLTADLGTACYLSTIGA